MLVRITGVRLSALPFYLREKKIDMPIHLKLEMKETRKHSPYVREIEKIAYKIMGCLLCLGSFY